MDNRPVDIFIPTISNHIPFIRRSFGSLFFQEYVNRRTVLWVEDPGTPPIEEFLNTIWYEPHERKQSPAQSDVPVSVEYCAKGVLARNYQGRTGNAWRARQWIFEWEGKSEFVKMLDSDDILMPWAINVMMDYMKDDIDCVFHPLISIAGRRLGGVIDIGNGPCIGGAAQMLIRSSLMKRILDDGFRWGIKSDDDIFYKFFREHGYKSALTTESAMYLYIK